MSSNELSLFRDKKWADLRERYPWATLVVAGDLNQDLGGRHYYGTKACRELLTAQLGGAGLTCQTTTDRFDPGVLQHPPIDHVCAGAGRDTTFASVSHGWNNATNGARLSDHGGTLVAFDVQQGTQPLVSG